MRTTGTVGGGTWTLHEGNDWGGPILPTGTINSFTGNGTDFETMASFSLGVSLTAGNIYTMQFQSSVDVTVSYDFNVYSGGVYYFNGGTNPGLDIAFKVLGVPDTFPPNFNGSGSTPNDNASDVDVSNNIIIDFDENIVKGNGNIIIRDVTVSTNFESFDISTATATNVPTNGNVGILNDKVYINPTNNFANDNNYAILIDAAAIDDLSGNSFAGINDDSTFNFTTHSLILTESLQANLTLSRTDFGQSFTPSTTGVITEFQLITTGAVGGGTWTLYEGSGWTGTVLASGTINPFTGNGTDFETVATSSPALNVTAGNTYTM